MSLRNVGSHTDIRYIQEDGNIKKGSCITFGTFLCEYFCGKLQFELDARSYWCHVLRTVLLGYPSGPKARVN
jgi:hypothetical protein